MRDPSAGQEHNAAMGYPGRSCPCGGDCFFSHNRGSTAPTPLSAKKMPGKKGNKEMACCLEVLVESGSCPYGKDRHPPCDFSHQGIKISEVRKNLTVLQKCKDQTKHIREHNSYRQAATVKLSMQGTSQDNGEGDEQDGDSELRGVRAAARSGSGLFYLDVGTPTVGQQLACAASAQVCVAIGLQSKTRGLGVTTTVAALTMSSAMQLRIAETTLKLADSVSRHQQLTVLIVSAGYPCGY